jgi:hypothetical protein
VNGASTSSNTSGWLFDRAVNACLQADVEMKFKATAVITEAAVELRQGQESDKQNSTDGGG